MVKSYAGELSNTEVKTNIFYPGAVRTAMRAKAMPGEDPETLPQPADIAPKLIDLLSDRVTENGRVFNVATDMFEDI